eukprot:scaffold2455_cov212-Chaetoceros_neogracile.AAC.44
MGHESRFSALHLDEFLPPFLFVRRDVKEFWFLTSKQRMGRTEDLSNHHRGVTVSYQFHCSKIDN